MKMSNEYRIIQHSSGWGYDTYTVFIHGERISIGTKAHYHSQAHVVRELMEYLAARGIHIPFEQLEIETDHTL